MSPGWNVDPIYPNLNMAKNSIFISAVGVALVAKSSWWRQRGRAKFGS
jgi:hypothetical protein